MKAFIWLCSATAIKKNSSGHFSDGMSVLSAAETCQLGKIKNPERRDQYLCSRALTRLALSYHFPQHMPMYWQLTTAGPPKVIGHNHEIALSLSHSGHLSACAIVKKTPDQKNLSIGIDCQVIKPHISWLKIAEHFFSYEERARLLQMNKTKAQQAFYRLWTQKEALIKAAGLNLPQGLSTPEQVKRQWQIESFNHADVPISIALPSTRYAIIEIREISSLQPFQWQTLPEITYSHLSN